MGTVLGAYPFGLAEEERTVVTGFKHDVELPYYYISLYADVKYPNLDIVECIITPIVSRTELRLFWGDRVYKIVGWDKRSPLAAVAYQTDACLIRDERKLDLILKTITDGFFSTVRERVSRNWPLAQTEEGEKPT